MVARENMTGCVHDRTATQDAARQLHGGGAKGIGSFRAERARVSQARKTRAGQGTRYTRSQERTSQLGRGLSATAIRRTAAEAAKRARLQFSRSCRRARPCHAAPPASATPADDGYLTSSEISALKLNADWVVLSACNTAGSDAANSEAFSGLARAFFYAGTRALLVSHWPVNSDAAVGITTGATSAMTSHPDIGPAEALRRSISALAAKGGHNAHPSAWAPFVLVGNGSP